MKIPIEKPAGFDPQAGTTTGEQGPFKFSSTTKYKKISSKNYNTFSCICATCHIIKDFAFEYYQNNSLLLDNDSMIHVPKVIE